MTASTVVVRLLAAAAVAFATLAHADLGFPDYVKLPPQITINPEAQGRVPTRSWYALRYKGQFRIGFTLNSAIGQGATTVTPLQLALAYAAIGNGGTVYMPQAVRAIEASDGAVLQDFPPRVRQRARVEPQNLQRITEALFAVVNEEHGTAYPVRDPALDIAGKTGTAQTGYVATGKDSAKTAWFLAKDHAWFASFAPYKSPEVAVVVLAEHGGSYAAAFQGSTLDKVLVIGVESDMLYPIHEQAAIAEAFDQNGIATRFARLPSLEGHDAFLVDIPRFDAEIRRFLS